MAGRWVALLLVLALDAGAWGGDGHRVIGEIAWQRLSPGAREALRPLLAAAGVPTLAEASVWADSVGRRDPQYVWARPLHYMNAQPRSEHVALDDRSCPTGEGQPGPAQRCVVAAVGYYGARLADHRLPREERAAAVLWLSHFVGDLHQPLHVAHPDMRGGNTIDLDVQGQHTSLHAFWDTGLVSLRRGQASWLDLAHDLTAQLSRADARRWRRGVPRAPHEEALTEWARRWAEQLVEVASTRSLFGMGDFATLPDSYVPAAFPILDALLQAAGVRLAAVLELALR